VHRGGGRSSGEGTTVALSRDGRWVATAADDGTIEIQECEICRPIPALIALAAARTTRALTPDERRRFIHG
jgi:hypothetical protein